MNYDNSEGNFCPPQFLPRWKNIQREQQKESKNFNEKGIAFLFFTTCIYCTTQIYGGGGEHLDVRIHVELRKTRTSFSIRKKILVLLLFPTLLPFFKKEK